MTLDASLVKRWKSAEGRARAKRVLDGLAAGVPPVDYGWGVVDGRLDLRGLPAPVPRRSNRREIGRQFVEELSGLLVIRNSALTKLDFSGAQIESLRIFDSTISDCVFDEVRCQDWRLWGSVLREVRFCGADLRRSVLGPWHDGRGNHYDHVSFAHADLRDISCQAATFVDCDFSYARIEQVDFQSTSFVRAKFAGDLREVIFWDRCFDIGKPDSNPMLDVDFAEARFKQVEFRRLNLDRVKFPQSEGHFVVSNYPCVMSKMLSYLKGDHSLIGRLLHATFEMDARWIGPHQRTGIVSFADFDEPGEAEFAEALLTRFGRECAEQK